ncbi:hypothetical protein TanjilG_02108 [Lupinus angustifolius]|nr:hypothetical protein TanjilG_02108 [Lupinus angustifolius]
MLDSIPEELRINILQRLYGPLISGNEVLHDISNEGYIKWELLSEDENGSVHRVVLLANSLLGEVGVLYCERHPFTIRTRTLSHMVKVNRKTIIDIGMTHADDIRLIMTNHCQYLSQHPIMKRASEMRRYTLTRPPIDLPLTLCSAVSATGDDDGLVTRLLQWGWDVNERDETGKSALYLAVSMTKTRRLNCLLENGADPNIKDFNGKLPLWEALQHGDKPMRDTLIRYGTILEERVKDEYAHSSNALNDNNLMDEILHYDVTLPTIASIVEECHEYECSVHIRDPYMEERRRAVPIAMDRAIKEIVSSIVQRSVSIATQTTKELVLKDYSMESDENRILNAAHLMVASLAGSLAHVTCKEPLRASISSQLRTSLQNLSIGSEILEQAVQLVTNDNLDLGCAVIEQAATDKAINTIDTDIGQQLSLRRKHREGMGSTFFDANLYTQGSMGGVPDYLRPKPGQLSLSQQRVYEDFVRLPWQNQSSQTSNSVSSVQSGNAGSVITGYEGVSRQLDDMAESNLSSQLSASSIHNRAADSSSQLSVEKDSVASFPSTASTPELHQVDSSDAVQESGASSQQLVSPGAVERFGSSFLESSLTTWDALDKYQIVAQKLEALVNNDSAEAEIQGVISEVPEIILKCVSRDEAALAVAQKVFKLLYDNASNSIHVSAHFGILTAIRDVCKLAMKELTSWVIYSEEERKFSKNITVGLIRSELLNLTDHSTLHDECAEAATEFSISLLQTLVIEEPKVISELHNLVDALAKLTTKPGSPETLPQLVEMVKKPAASSAALYAGNAGKDDKARQSTDNKDPGLLVANREELITVESVEPDPAGFREQVSMVFAEWYRICELPGANDTASAHFISQLHQNILLKGDDVTDRFFRLLMELSVAHCLSTEVINSGAMQSPQQLQPMSFLAIDVYAKLVFSILKGSSKLILLSKILAVTVRFILEDVEEKKMSFNPRPYFRLFINWLLDLGSLEPVIDGANLQVCVTFILAY